MLTFGAAIPAQRSAGSLRGIVFDDDLGVPLGGVRVLLVETREAALTSDQGNFVFATVAPGNYTLVFTRDGYARQVKADVAVVEGRLTDVEVRLSGEYTEMDEFVVQDLLQLGGATESGLLQLRFGSSAMMDSIGSELMSRAGAGDAAAALRLVTGASVQDGKYAVIRGLPDRYISSQLNGVRLPSADEDKRAVELDQFPTAILESIQVTKTFTPDQQGDASGGAVNVKLKGIPDETVFELKGQYSYNSQVAGRDDFLTYDGGGLSYWGNSGGNDMQLDKLGQSWDGAVGTTRDDAPIDYKWSLAAGGKRELASGWRLGGFASLFYERDSSFYDDGVDNSLWVETPGGPMVPETKQGASSSDEFKTALFDTTQGSQSVQWGGLGTVGIENDEHSVSLTALYTRTAEDTATLAEDTNGKAYFFPSYDPDDPTDPGNDPLNLLKAPYLRMETLEYTERVTASLQLDGEHELPFGEFDLGDDFAFQHAELEWRLSHSTADLDQPDKRVFGALWTPEAIDPGIPGVIPPSVIPPQYQPYKPDANFNLGNLQRIWKTIEEESDQGGADLRLPFEQWSGDEGYLKFGVYADHLTREFDQDTFSNFGDSDATYVAEFDQFWSEVFPSEDHPINASPYDIDYRGEQDVSAWYSMVDLPLSSSLELVGGARFESTDISIVNEPEQFAFWYPPGSQTAVDLLPGDADVDFSQDDVLPSIGLIYRPAESVTLRGSYGETVARQTFKELTPIQQQEYAGADIFVGNPFLQMSAIRNYDVRADYAPREGSLISASLFHKDIRDAIEYVQVPADTKFTTAKNYPEGRMSGVELELRQQLGEWWRALDGFALGANATFIESKVTLPAEDQDDFSLPEISAPTSSRDMTNAPEHLYNLYLIYDAAATRTQFSLFYTVQGDTLVAGAGVSDISYIPDVYAKEYGTLNLGVSQALGEHWKLVFQAKNLTNPDIETVYRSKYIADDVTHTSYSKGVELSIGFSLSL